MFVPLVKLRYYNMISLFVLGVVSKELLLHDNCELRDTGETHFSQVVMARITMHFIFAILC